jgi:hypothetical protein
MLCKKTSYSSEFFALQHIEIISNKSRRPTSLKSAYLCKKCNTWHITKQENTKYLREELEKTKELLKSRENELFKLKIKEKNIENGRNNSSGTNSFQIKILLLEKELIAVKAKSATNGKKFNDVSVKLNTVKNIVNKAIKNKFSLEELIIKIQEELKTRLQG